MFCRATHACSGRRAAEPSLFLPANERSALDGVAGENIYWRSHRFLALRVPGSRECSSALDNERTCLNRGQPASHFGCEFLYILPLCYCWIVHFKFQNLLFLTENVIFFLYIFMQWFVEPVSPSTRPTSTTLLNFRRPFGLHLSWTGQGAAWAVRGLNWDARGLTPWLLPWLLQTSGDSEARPARSWHAGCSRGAARAKAWGVDLTAWKKVHSAAGC